MDIWTIKDKIKNGTIDFVVGDEIVVFRRKKNGHPRSIKDGERFFVKTVEREFLIVAKRGPDNGWTQQVKVHKYYVMPRSVWREIRLNSLLDDILK